MTKRALIAGGSLGGLMTGILLRKAGWQVDIFEKVGDDMSGRGGGIATQDVMWEIIAEAGIDVGARPGVKLNRRVVFARDGSVIEERAIKEIVSSWDTIYRLLRRPFPEDHYHQGKAVTEVEQTATRVKITFADGDSAEGDLLVACDGAGSTLRQKLMPEVRSVYADYIAWRGLQAERDLPKIVRDELLDAFSFCRPDGEQMLSYTIPGPHGEEAQGERRHNFVWYQPAEPDHVLPDLLTDADGHEHRPNIPPPKMRAEVVEAMRRHADAVLSPAYAAYVRAVEQPFIQPIADHYAPSLVAGRVAFVGDSGAQARPHVGAGTSKAMQDAAALARALAAHDDVVVALAAYDAERQPEARRMVERGRWLGHGLTPDGEAGEDQANETLITTTARPEGWDEDEGRYPKI